MIDLRTAIPFANGEDILAITIGAYINIQSLYKSVCIPCFLCFVLKSTLGKILIPKVFFEYLADFPFS